MRKRRINWLVSSVASFAFLLGTSAVQAQSDVTAPGDPITGSSGNAPSAEGVANLIDNNTATKYLNFDKLNVGFTVTPSTGPKSIVTGIALTSANDAPDRDPASYTLEGSHDGFVWTMISSGPVAPFATRFERQQIDFANAVAYRHYRVVFPTVFNEVGANSMQLAEVELIGTANTPAAPFITSASSQNNPNAITLTFDRNVGAGSYAVDNGVVVSGAAFGPSQNVVVLDVSTTPLVYNTVYTVTVTGLGTDPDPVSYAFRHGEGVIQGAITRRVYKNIGGGNVSDLVNNARFPCAPDSVSSAMVNFEFGTNPAFNNSGHPNNTENYGAWLQGIFVAPATGIYGFGLAGDDGSSLYISTDENPANKVLHIAQSGARGSRVYSGNPIAGVALVEGQRYYMETLFKEGGGGDHVAVAVQVPGGPAITDGQAPIPDTMFAPVYWGDCGRTPFTYFGPVSIVQDIQNKAVLEADVINFRIRADGSPNYSYQWYSNNVAIPGANSAGLSFVARPSANNAEFYAVVQNSFSSATSAVATVSVTPTPQVVSVSSRLDASSIYVAFSKPVRATEALDAASYVVTNSAGVAVGIANISYLGGSNQTVRLEATAPLAIGESYGVVISEIRDTDGNIMTPNPTVAQFTHAQGVNAPAGLTRKIYLNINGGAVTDLTGNAAFPCSPSETDTGIAAFEYGTNPARNNQGRGDTENYGTWIHGIFVPPTTGNYQFGMSADDGAALYLSTDSSPANKVLLTSQAAWNANREYVTATSGGTAVPLSPVVQLQAGQRYYMEGLSKEGGGGDHIAVTVRKPGDPAIVNGQAPISRDLFATNFSVGCPPTAFFSTLGPVFLTLQPVNQNVFELAPAVFQVGIDGAPPYSVQWYSNNVAVPGATGSRYAFNPLRYANNAQYYAVVQNGFSAVTSAPVVLTVTSDDIPPTLLSARGTQGRREAVLAFSEPLNLATATNLANYSITNSAGAALAISSIRAISSSNVVITTDLQAEGERYTVVVNNVQDVAGVPNTIAANSTISFSGFVYTPGFALMEVYNTPGGNTVNILTTNANYPYFPRQSFYITRMNSRLGYPTDANEAYGGRISGLFVPPTNGNYVILFSSDDDGLFRGSSDESPANIAVNVPLPGCCAAWGDGGRQTPPLPLSMGSRYYYELIWKEGTGGDYAAGSLNTTDPLPGSGVVNVGVPSPFLGIYANPDDTQISLTQSLPANIDTVANQYLGLTVAAMNTAGFPQVFQWQRWDSATSTFTNIPGAFGTDAGTLIYGPTTEEDDGIQIRAIAYAPGVSAVSTTTIAINPDTEQPRLVAASGNATLEQVLITFSEPMDPVGLDEPFYYYMTDGTTDIFFNDAVITSPTNVLLTVDPSTGVMAEGTVYTVIAQEGIFDANGNPVDIDNNSAMFTSWVRTPLTAKYEFYLSIGGGAVNDLLNNAKYPSRPDVVYFTNSLDWPQSSPDMNDYGLRMSGYFRPPVSGNYTFYLKYDDGARFQLSTDQSAANLQTLIDVGCCSGTFAQPRVVNLVGGNAYYFEVIVKEAGGGDYLTLGVVPPGGGAPVAVDGGYLTNAINPTIVTINPGIQTQPQSQVFTEGGSANFSVVVTNVGGFGALYQWQVNDGSGFVDIPGATGASYNTGPLPISASGDAYRVLISAPGKMLTSATATVTVNPDTAVPTVISVGSANGTQIGVQFSEPVDALSAEEEINYIVNGTVVPTSATLRGDGSQVVLIVDTPVEGDFTVEIQNISDRATTPNVLALTNIVGSRWIDTVVDIGNPNPPGQHFSAAEGDIEIVAGGNDVWGASDQFTYAYRPQTGDFDVRVRVDSIQYVGNAWSKAGLNIRESVDPGSRMVWVYPTPTQGANAFEGAVRAEPNVDVIDFGQPRPVAFFPAHVRVVRSGSVFTAYLSQDGATWNIFGTPQNLPQFPATLLVGVGAVSHIDGVSSAAKFSDFTIVAKLGASIAGGAVTIVWDGEGVLQYADNINGPWTDLPAATSPYVAPADQPQRFYRVVVPAPPE